MQVSVAERIRKLGLPVVAAWVVVTACNLGTPPTAVPTPSATPSEVPPTATATDSASATPSATFTQAITLTPSYTPSPAPTLTPTATFTPTATVPPPPAVAIALDNYQTVTIEEQVREGIGGIYLSFINVNDKPATGTVTPGTPPPSNNLATIYLISPALPNTRIRVLDLPASTDTNVFWSPNGAFIAYFLRSGEQSGLYLTSLELGYQVRLFALDNLSPRGVANPPVWSPDSRQITLALSTATDLDIFSVSPDGSNFRNFSQNLAHDFWPVWSPDGQFMAFVSDRAVCKTWEPNAPDTCYSEDAPPPDGGHLYLYAAANGEVRKLSDDWLTAPPRWITPMRVGYSAGTRGDPIAETALKWVNALTGTVTTISPEGTSALNEAWTVDGSKVIYQEIGTDADIVVRDENGNELGRLADLDFPRFGFAAAWSPDGLRLVVGGRNGQCPYGMTLFNDALESLFRAQPRPGVCDPEFSPDGRYVAFGGVQPGADGAFDLYLSSPSGGGIRSVTGRFGGQIRPLGWVGRAR